MSRYRTIVADPPWPLEHKPLGRGGRRKNATEVPYSFMSLDAIHALEVGEWAEDGCVLFLWSTRKLFREGVAVSVARAWGFEPCGEIIWGLRNPGTGSKALANDHEPCLVATAGKFAQLVADRPLGVHFWRQVYEWNPNAKVPQKKHSAKSPGFYEFVEQIAQPPRLELFAREQRLGWDTWGNEALEHVSLAAGASGDTTA
jgi:N6-adenosine-specific RNA methylase IME4